MQVDDQIKLVDSWHQAWNYLWILGTVLYFYYSHSIYYKSSIPFNVTHRCNYWSQVKLSWDRLLDDTKRSIVFRPDQYLLIILRKFSQRLVVKCPARNSIGRYPRPNGDFLCQIFHLIVQDYHQDLQLNIYRYNAQLHVMVSVNHQYSASRDARQLTCPT